MILNRWYHASELLTACAMSALVGIMAGWAASKVPHNRNEKHAVEVRQDDGSVILERNPERKPVDLPQLPPHSTVTRVTSFTIKPVDEPGAIQPRKPIEVGVFQVQTPDGSRMIVKSSDGTIIEGGDWTNPERSARVYRWQAQAVRAWTWEGSAWGASIGYTRGPVVGTVTAFPGQVQLGIGFRW